MDLSRTLNPHDFLGLNGLASGHPVWELLFKGGDSIVLKAEGGVNSNRMVGMPLAIVSAIDPNAQSVLLNKQELMFLRDWCRNNAHAVSEQRTQISSYIQKALAPPSVVNGSMKSNQQAVLYKMAKKRKLVELGDAGDLRISGDKSKVKEIAHALNQPGALEKLGEILAVDAFIGNNDRVNFEWDVSAGGGATWGGMNYHGTPLKCVQNVGNFFFGFDGGPGVPVALDSYDYTSDFKDLSSVKKYSMDLDWNEYSGNILAANQAPRRSRLASCLCEDFETILGPRNRKIRFMRKQRLPKGAQARVARGMDSGAAKVLAYLRKTYAHNPPEGISARCNAIGWTLG